jgi:hypothetical protein
MTTRYVSLALIACAALLVPIVANAQQLGTGTATRPADAKYCETLAQRYSAQHPIMEGPNASIAAAMNDCQSDPQGSTATLMRAMEDERITIPPRP